MKPEQEPIYEKGQDKGSESSEIRARMRFEWLKKRVDYLVQVVSDLESIKDLLSEEEMGDLGTELKNLYDELEVANKTAARLKSDVERIRSKSQK